MKRHISFSIIWLVFVLFFNACNSNPENDKRAKVIYGETALKNFVQSSHDMAPAIAVTQLDSILATAAQDSSVFQQTVNFLVKPFSDPNSVYRNEGLYAALLRAKMKSPWCDSLVKMVATKKLHLLMQNQPGTEANDFVYITPAGGKKKMYDIKADYTLLLFYNPECNACKDMKTALMASNIINSAIVSGKLRLLAVYTDKDETVWRKYLPEMPEAWIEGRDENEYLYNNKVYDLKAIPTLYLLDRNKKVLLKDVLSVPLIEQQLKRSG